MRPFFRSASSADANAFALATFPDSCEITDPGPPGCPVWDTIDPPDTTFDDTLFLRSLNEFFRSASLSFAEDSAELTLTSAASFFSAAFPNASKLLTSLLSSEPWVAALIFACQAFSVPAKSLTLPGLAVADWNSFRVYPAALPK